MRVMYVERVTQPSFFSRLDVRTKLLIVCLVSILVFVWEHVVYQGALFLAVLSLTLSAHIGWAYLRRLLAFMSPFIVLVLLIHGLWNDVGCTPLWEAPASTPLIGGNVGLYWEGLIFGLMVNFRMLSSLLVLPLMVLTTDVNDLVVGLVRLRVPYKVAFIFAIALRFVPFIFTEINAIMEAQRLRGLALEQMNIFRRIPVIARLAVPLVLGSLLKAQTLEVVLQSKAFSGSPQRTFLNEIRLRSADYAIIIGGVALFAGALVARLALGWGSFVG